MTENTRRMVLSVLAVSPLSGVACVMAPAAEAAPVDASWPAIVTAWREAAAEYSAAIDVQYAAERARCGARERGEPITDAMVREEARADREARAASSRCGDLAEAIARKPATDGAAVLAKLDVLTSEYGGAGLDVLTSDFEDGPAMLAQFASEIRAAILRA